MTTIEKAIKTEAKEQNNIPAKPKRRTLSASYKAKILDKIDAYKKEGRSINDLLRQEGLYSGQVSNWRTQMSANKTDSLSKKRGPKADPAIAEKRKIDQLEKELLRTQKRLKEAEAIIDIQKKLSSLLGVNLPDNN